jgi:ubiquinone/menaquinone biosynthesis C-methylase UbiE
MPTATPPQVSYTMDARDYNARVMQGFFKKIYPVIAAQILARTGVTTGRCVDLGGGPGMLGIEYARRTGAQVEICDPLPDCIEVARENIAAAGLSARMRAQLGCAEALPYEDDSVDLVMSRGSIYFWSGQTKGLAEVQRVLRPGGWAFIGGGMGNAALLAEIAEARKHDPKWQEGRRKRSAANPPEHFAAIVRQLGLPAVVEDDEVGTWIIWRKA